MNTYTVPIPSGFEQGRDDAGTVQHWLEAQNIEVGAVSVLNIEDEDGTFHQELQIRSASNPQEALSAFVATEDPKAKLKERLSEINVETANIDQLKEAVSVIKELLTQTETL